MVSIYFECDDAGRDILSAELNERGTLGILELPGGLRAWFDDAAAVADLVSQYDAAVTDEPATNEDWVQRTEDSFPAIPLGTRFWLAPEWNHEPAPDGRMRLEITPGMACGTGWHECTQLCLEGLERLVTPGCSVFDVGTGSGILSVAARMLGAGRVVSCDIDPDAVAIARERLGTNTAFTGTADAGASHAFDVVVANISPTVVHDLYPEFVRVARPGGILILSGFGDYPLDVPAVELTRRGEWLCAVLRAGSER